MDIWPKLCGFSQIGPEVPGAGPITALFEDPEGVIALRSENGVSPAIPWLLRNIAGEFGSNWEKVTVH